MLLSYTLFFFSYNNEILMIGHTTSPSVSNSSFSPAYLLLFVLLSSVVIVIRSVFVSLPKPPSGKKECAISQLDYDECMTASVTSVVLLHAVLIQTRWEISKNSFNQPNCRWLSFQVSYPTSLRHAVFLTVEPHHNRRQSDSLLRKDVLNGCQRNWMDKQGIDVEWRLETVK